MSRLLEVFIRANSSSEEDTDTCDSSNDYNGRELLRIVAIFMVMAMSAFGSFLPLLSSKYSSIRLPQWVWFLAKFFGSGVIVATGFVHLLQPANEALSNDCLTGLVTEYPWAFGICLMSLFALFFSEIIAHHFLKRATRGGSGQQGTVHSHSHFGELSKPQDDEALPSSMQMEEDEYEEAVPLVDYSYSTSEASTSNYYPQSSQQQGSANYFSQILSVFILEFGIVFHSVFVGLSLAVAGEEFQTLFVVIMFHQMFEGLGLGTRIAECPWDESRRRTPWILALGFTLTTPTAIAIGLCVRSSYSPGSARALIINGVFDAISSGILIYTGLVELMAHEFLYSSQFDGEDGLTRMLVAFLVMCSGAGLMALLGKWT
ncbi:ZIP zinc/iron transport family [Cyberlindnera jadinii NRRL Y-1542]|uniref:ZIP zinc/iron transport family n=1 Tax=Cyberlindnera jadinii (strain ATCC 18201 / CBS 1600 / BCRC 20928 / JCM 3617 / NBRC 0987 / NRRL Y-1542) TaxID=983966 RepID=A0A1E4S921_CYBJN|nr:ZIP zinc/iron transport family [Cyberlindnera jadinii NRRL Y-1542]ODV76001.1 ZIP zinc/iron transport family [Cyberlindnera jadinii NRRL Y-1542]